MRKPRRNIKIAGLNQRFYFICAIVVLIFKAESFGNPWTLVYPETYPLSESLPFYSIGSRELEGDMHERQIMVGSRNGFAILSDPTSAGNSTIWESCKFPLPFDITAVGAINGRWVLGGTNGFLAIQRAQKDFQLKENWEVLRFEATESIEQIACSGSRIMVRFADQLAVSDDLGVTWSVVQTDVKDLVKYDEEIYSLSVKGKEVSLMRSDVEIWKCKLSVPDLPFDAPPNKISINSYLLPDSLGLCTRSRLFYCMEFSYTIIHTETTYSIFVSTCDGFTFLDHGSFIREVTNNGIPSWAPPYRETRTTTEWNPLGLKEEALNQTAPEGFDYPTDASFRIRDETLEYYKNGIWEEVMTSSARGHKFLKYVVQWDRLFLFYGGSTIAVDAEGEIENLGRTGKFARYNGAYYKYGQGEYLGEYQSFLSWTNDFQTWDQQPVEDLDPDYMFQAGDKLAMVYAHWAEPEVPRRVNLWKGETEGVMATSEDARSVAYQPVTDTWYQLRINRPNGYPASDRYVAIDTLTFHADTIYFPIVLEDPGNLEAYRFFPGTWNGYFKRLSCPDGENLIAYGDTAEFALIEQDGTIHFYHPWSYFPSWQYQIQSVVFTNGYYYLLGPVALRTRDFEQYESIELPNDEPLIHLTEFNGDLYGLTETALYKRHAERGYMDSLESTQGWHHADWLGWFQIIDEEVGEIDHLLLGKCWVKPVNELEYWIRTEALDWIYMNKNWSPWFWRMDDAHWYWLVHDSWPGRAWDYDDQEWEEL